MNSGVLSFHWAEGTPIRDTAYAEPPATTAGMDLARWFLPLTVVGVVATTIAHSATLVGVARGSAIEGNPYAVLLGMGKLGIPIASGIIGGAYFLTWMVDRRFSKTRSDALLAHAAVVCLTVFLFCDMVNDLVVVF
jgi:uncharacterized membrane-anchored protein YitT (DUF2179 family)